MSIRSAQKISDLLIKAANPLAAPVISLLFPQECGLCGGSVRDLGNGNVCESCWSQTNFFDIRSPICDKCGAFNAGANSKISSNCGRCYTQSFDRAFALGSYEKGLRNSILALKSKPYLPEIVFQKTKERFQSFAPINFDLIIPVPLSRQREFERGFNQAEVIADTVARLTGFPVDRNSLLRTGHTKMHRAGMDQKSREKTVENAFAIARPKMIAGMDILLTDDVFTSGATASACASLLKSHGALSVTVFTIARAEFRAT